MSTQSRIAEEAQKGPETLEREIDQQRESISNIVHALENKLSPGELLDQALHYAKGNGGEFFGNLGTTIKANPVPTLLTALGLTWLIAGQNHQPASSHVGQGAGMKQGLKDKAGQLRDSWGSTRQRLSDSSHRAADGLRHQGERARDGFEHMLTEQPLALGAIGIALGALLGASLPSTRQEDRLMGEASDRLTGKAKAAAEEGYSELRETGQRLGERIQRPDGAGQQRTSGPL